MGSANQSDPKSLRQSLFWITVALVSFLTMAIAARELSDTLSPFVIVFFRTFFGFLIISATVVFNGFKYVSARRLEYPKMLLTLHLDAKADGKTNTKRTHGLT